MKKKAVGERGSWFAKVDGERLPCVHKHWVQANIHNDPGYLEGEPKWDDLRSAIEEKRRVILTKDDASPAPEKRSGVAFTRTGYIGVFEIEDVRADQNGLRFVLTNRLCDLQ